MNSAKTSKAKVPQEIDYDLLNRWIRKGDQIKIAADTEMSESMVSATLRALTFNEDILCAAWEIVKARMTKVLERQAEVKRMEELINSGQS